MPQIYTSEAERSLSSANWDGPDNVIYSDAFYSDTMICNDFALLIMLQKTVWNTWQQKQSQNELNYLFLSQQT